MNNSIASKEHILVVEDDPSLAEWIVDYLSSNGYAVTLATNGDVAVELVKEDLPHLVILDINLPKKNGFEVCEEIRPFFTNPVLMLTARGDESDEVQGLSAGANDYLVKPVRPKALLARLDRLLGRGAANQVKTIRFDAFSIDLTSRSVTLHNETIAISSNEFDLLWLLASNAGNVMSREEIVSQLRGIEYDGVDRSVEILISRLRKKLGDNASKPYRIKTVRAKGYILATDAWN